MVSKALALTLLLLATTPSTAFATTTGECLENLNPQIEVFYDRIAFELAAIVSRSPFWYDPYYGNESRVNLARLREIEAFYHRRTQRSFQEDARALSSGYLQEGQPVNPGPLLGSRRRQSLRTQDLMNAIREWRGERVEEGLVTAAPAAPAAPIAPRAAVVTEVAATPSAPGEPFQTLFASKSFQDFGASSSGPTGHGLPVSVFWPGSQPAGLWSYLAKSALAMSALNGQTFFGVASIGPSSSGAMSLVTNLVSWAGGYALSENEVAAGTFPPAELHLYVATFARIRSVNQSRLQALETLLKNRDLSKPLLVVLKDFDLLPGSYMGAGVGQAEIVSALLAHISKAGAQADSLRVILVSDDPGKAATTAYSLSTGAQAPLKLWGRIIQF